MSRKTSKQWGKLVEQQISSGLSVPKFCEKHQLSTKYFYARKSIAAKESNSAGFLQAKVVTQHTTVIAQQAQQPIKFTTPVGELLFPQNTPATFLAQLLNGLTHENV